MLASSLKALVNKPKVYPNVARRLYGSVRPNTLVHNARTRFAFQRNQRFICTTPQRNAPPLIALLMKTGGVKVMKALSIVFGRSFRKLYDKLPDHVRMRIGKHKIVISVGGTLVPFVAYYSYTHCEYCEITGRKRWITFTKEQLAALANLEYENLIKHYEGKLLPASHELYQKNANIVVALIKANSDIDSVRNTDWTLHVVDDPAMSNAFVLPNGHIFVFTGMLKILNNWQEMAIILGHEMSHAILGHSQEQQSYLAFSEVLTVPLLAFIWFFFDDFAAFLVYTIQSYIVPLVFEYGFSLPYSRELELEADKVGLMLSSKACFDPRWGVLLWEKMAFQQTLNDEADSDKFEYLSTHPGNQKRSLSLEKMIPHMLEIRKLCNCPNLPHNIDPQAAAYHMRLCVANTRERKELVATLAALEGIDDAGLKEGKVDKAEKQRLEEKIERARHRLVELEVEYSKLTGGDNNKVEEPTRKQAEDHLFKAVWGRISGQIAVSGKLTDTLFEKETPVLSAATLPSAVGRGTKS